jgi:hypothetical protein
MEEGLQKSTFAYIEVTNGPFNLCGSLRQYPNGSNPSSLLVDPIQLTLGHIQQPEPYILSLFIHRTC